MLSANLLEFKYLRIVLRSINPVSPYNHFVPQIRFIIQHIKQ